MEDRVIWHRMNLCPLVKNENRQPLLEVGSEKRQTTRLAQSIVKDQGLAWCQINYQRFLLIIKRKMRMSVGTVGTMAVMDSCVSISKTTPKNNIQQSNLR